MFPLQFSVKQIILLLGNSNPSFFASSAILNDHYFTLDGFLCKYNLPVVGFLCKYKLPVVLL